MRDLEYYKSCTTDDFIVDEDFRAMVHEAGSNSRLDELLKSLPGKHREINIAVKIIRGLKLQPTTQSTERKEVLWQEILQSRKTIFRLQNYLKMAASIILLIGIGGTLFYLAHPVKTAPEIISGNTDYRDAKLILSNGKTVLLNNKQSKVQFSANGIDILLNDSSGIVQTLEKEGLNQLIVPFGTRTDIILSDGTKVFLNSGSKLEFPPVFKGKSRQVILEGEAYFEVAPDKDKPFYVKTDAFSTKVYGTKFNIQVYKSDDLSNIVLVEGKVSVLPVKEQNSPGILLAPNQKASIAKNDPTFIVTNVEDTDAYTAWVKGYLTFSNEEISAVLKRVARYYNVEIETALPENTEKIYGKLDLKDDLERVLNGIAFISKTKFQRQADKYVFMVDKPE